MSVAEHPVFPMTADGIAEFEACVEAKKKDVASELEKRRAVVRDAENEQKWLTEIGKILSGLHRSWSETDPGKYRLAHFFLEPATAKRVVAREFLPPDTKIYTTKYEWDRYTDYGCKDFRFSGYEGVPPHYRVVPLAEVATGMCSLCGEAHPLIESYSQTSDGPSGDEWSMTTLVICPNKMEYLILHRREESQRFR